MLDNGLNVSIMQKCAGLFIATCLVVCLTFNSTLPLHRDLSNEAHKIYPNQTHRCDVNERTKKENTLRRIKESTHDFGRNIYDHLNTGIKTLANRDSITEDDIRQYEQLVLMKKYPYVDLKTLEMKYGPVPYKNTRQSAFAGLQNEPGIHWDAADLLNVEIINRGLSGFAIPPLLGKHTETDGKLSNNIVRNTMKDPEKDRIRKRPSDRDVLESLKDDINSYIERKTAE